MTISRLPVSNPAEQGVDAAGIAAFLDAVEAAPSIEPHSLVVVRHGNVVAEGWWAPYGRDRVHLLYSLSKSFTSTAVGFAVAEGLVDLDRTVLSYFPEIDGDITDPRSRTMLVRHVAAMASGHTAEALARAVDADRDDLVRGYLRVPPDRDPGTVFAYSQPNTFTLGAIVQRVTGESLTGYLRPRLFDPLGIDEALWQRDRSGREIGFSGLHVTTDSIAALGQLVLGRGMWQGRRLIDAAWFDEATRSHIPTAGEPNPDWQQGYGFQFWRSRHGFRGDGAYGQFCLVLPEQDAVVVTTAATPDMQLLLDLVWQHLLPAFGVAALDGSGDAALADRLAGLALPVPDGAPQPAGDPQRWRDAPFTPAGGTCVEQPSLTAVELTADDDGWSIGMVEDGSRLVGRLGAGGWATSHATGPRRAVPLAVAGGWTDRNTLRAEVTFLETPHRLVLSCSLPTRTFTATWATRPLGGDQLSRLSAPRPAAGPTPGPVGSPDAPAPTDLSGWR